MQSSREGGGAEFALATNERSATTFSGRRVSNWEDCDEILGGVRAIGRCLNSRYANNGGPAERQVAFARFEPQTPRFSCTCSRERVARMIRSLGQREAQSILAERGEIDVGCDFCGRQYRFDAVDTAQIFTSPGDQPPVSPAVQ